ncbi:zinc finger protein 260-like [Salvelinus alpinus]|uniref:zinc finger protein 260-like n=1 Tax=Salvelinus alpinus TaxID=8036 RepID=UPI0039FD6224
MSKLQQINVFLNEKLTAVPLEISVLVKKTIAEHQEEISRLKRANARLRRLLDLVFKPEIKLHRLADLQLLTLTEEEVNPEQQHREQEWRANLGLQESDAEESIWNSINITVENRTESDGESYSESESTSDYEPPSDSDNSESDHVHMDNRIRLSGLKPLKSKRGRGRPKKETGALPDLKCDVCIKCFATASGLRRHLQNWHSEERPIGLPRKETNLQLLTLTEEEVNPEQQHREQEWSANLGPQESDAEESIWNSINIITVENRTESDGESYSESESTSDYEPPSDSDNSESDHVHMDNRIRLSGSQPLKSKRGRGQPRKETRALPDLKCDVCGKCLATARSLKRHHQNRHLEERPRGRPRKETSEFPDLKCDVCGKCFVTRGGLRMHEKNRHSEERPYMCDICGQGFVLNCYLIRHMKTHTEEGQHCCTVCGKCFNHKNNLKNHMGTHTGPAFKCDLCGKCLTTKGSLKQHQQNHTGEKLYPCKECDKSFSIKGSLILHMRTHTGEKPFRCKECGKCFSDKGTLTKHMMTHTEEKPHSCNKCGKCFSLKGNLTVHMKVHTGEGVQCHLCGTHLKLASSLKRHLRTHKINSQ